MLKLFAVLSTKIVYISLTLALMLGIACKRADVAQQAANEAADGAVQALNNVGLYERIGQIEREIKNGTNVGTILERSKDSDAEGIALALGIGALTKDFIQCGDTWYFVRRKTSKRASEKNRDDMLIAFKNFSLGGSKAIVSAVDKLNDDPERWRITCELHKYRIYRNGRWTKWVDDNYDHSLNATVEFHPKTGHTVSIELRMQSHDGKDPDLFNPSITSTDTFTVTCDMVKKIEMIREGDSEGPQLRFKYNELPQIAEKRKREEKNQEIEDIKEQIRIANLSIREFLRSELGVAPRGREGLGGLLAERITKYLTRCDSKWFVAENMPAGFMLSEITDLELDLSPINENEEPRGLTVISKGRFYLAGIEGQPTGWLKYNSFHDENSHEVYLKDNKWTVGRGRVQSKPDCHVVKTIAEKPSDKANFKILAALFQNWAPEPDAQPIVPKEEKKVVRDPLSENLFYRMSLTNRNNQ